MKKIWVKIALILGIATGGAYGWYWQSLHHVVIVSQPSEKLSQTAIVSATESDKQEKLATTSNDWINTLILGTDKGDNEVSRADSMMLVSANVETHQVAVISIPRDTRVNLQGVGQTKINHANAVGVSEGGVRQGTLESAKAVSDLLGVTINYYAKINFQGFQKVIDAVGGIDINLPYPVNDDSSEAYFSAGEQHLSGDEALRLARSRYGVTNGDFDRQKDQFFLLSALAHQMLSLSNISKLPEELNIIHQDLVDSNLSTPEMLTLGLAFKGITKDEIKYYQLPGKGITALDPLVGTDVYYYEPDMDGVKRVVEEALKLKF